MDASPKHAPRRLAGLLVRKPRWGLSRRGWLVAALSVLIGGWWARDAVYPFLAITDRAGGGELVVEGWVHDFALRAGVAEFKAGAHRRVFTTGGPLSANDGYTTDLATSARTAAEKLIGLGVPEHLIVMARSRATSRDRTFSSAVALREWFREHHITIRRLDVVTENVHARRTRLLFQKAFGRAVTVGVIAVPDPDYDALHWWRYSEGVKDVISEGACYLYARFAFHPNEPTSPHAD